MSLTKPQCVCEDAVLVFAGLSQGCFDDDNLLYLMPAREEFEQINDGGRGSGLSQVVTGMNHEENSKFILCSRLQTSYILSNPGDDPPKDWRNGTLSQSLVPVSCRVQLDYSTVFETKFIRRFVTIAECFSPPQLEVTSFTTSPWKPSVPANKRVAVYRGK